MNDFATYAHLSLKIGYCQFSVANANPEGNSVAANKQAVPSRQVAKIYTVRANNIYISANITNSILRVLFCPLNLIKLSNGN